MAMDLGSQIKELRKERNMTLRDLAEASKLSTGFLSQLERGRTTISVDSLEQITQALGVEPGHFFKRPKQNGNKNTDTIIRSYDVTVSFSESDKFVHQYLTRNAEGHHLFPEIILMMPEEEIPDEEDSFRHKGEEFVYVLEGMLTLNYGHGTHKLYPGDSFLFTSKVPHNWYNSTNQITKILVVRYPNPFLPKEGDSSE
ncbi:MAG: XRE family transcriptional regulator [Clostridiales Family XIII bacterium]|jgi:transcriptional regulator with XRE-family HTH domain|nr:XRE family transcriptional regulator [Clostridiales Family XIII bacterium]